MFWFTQENSTTTVLQLLYSFRTVTVQKNSTTTVLQLLYSFHTVYNYYQFRITINSNEKLSIFQTIVTVKVIYSEEHNCNRNVKNCESLKLM